MLESEMHVMHIGRAGVSLGIGTLKGRIIYTVAAFNPKDHKNNGRSLYSRKRAYKIIESRFAKDGNTVFDVLSADDESAIIYTGDSFKRDVFDKLIESLRRLPDPERKIKGGILRRSLDGKTDTFRISYDSLNSAIQEFVESLDLS